MLPETIDGDTHFHDDDSAHEELDAMHAAWERQQNADAVADADEQQARDAMSDTDADAADAAELDEAIRIARDEADAAEYEYDRLVAYRTRRTVGETLNAIAAGNMNAVDAVAALFGKAG